jgi:simple sugar transport system permease protein
MSLTIERRTGRSFLITALSPLLAVVLTLASGALLFAALGKDPLRALSIYFFSPLAESWALQEILVKATPLTLIAVGLAICYRANVWNIGAEGQFLIGAVVGGGLGVATQGTDAGPWVLPAMLTMGALGGALYAFIPAWCRVRYGASEILTSLMLVYVAELILDYLVRGPWRDPKGFNFPTTAAFDASATMPTLLDGSRVHIGVVIALVAVAVSWIAMSRTLPGFAVRLVGAAPKAARFAGFDAGALTIATLMVSGGLAGLAGIVEVTATVGHLQPNISPGYGFTAIIVAFLGRLHPCGILAAAMFLALTFIGGESAQITLKVPLDLTKVFQGMLLFYVLACDTLVHYRVHLSLKARKAGGTA